MLFPYENFDIRFLYVECGRGDYTNLPTILFLKNL